jgi:adenosylcobinamide-GDP ribazoletransferase
MVDAVGQVGRSIGFFPLVGFIIGCVLALLYYALRPALPAPVIGALLTAALAIITGAHHLDGLIDTCDGMAAGKTREERLAIMSDTRTGAFGITSVAILLLIKYNAITAALGPVSLLVFPVLSRWSLTGAILIFPVAKDTGSGHAVKSSAGWPGYVIATVTALIIAIALTGLVTGTLLMACLLILVCCAGLVFNRLYGGLTGDCYGALVEIGEVLAILLFLAIGHLMPASPDNDLFKLMLPS